MKARLIDHFHEQLSFHRPQKRNVTEFVFSRDLPTGILVEKCALAIEAAERAVDESLTGCDIAGLDSHVPPQSYPEPLLDC